MQVPFTIDEFLNIFIAYNSSIWHWHAYVGGVLLFYGLIIYPILGYFLDHRYPASLTLGVREDIGLFVAGGTGTLLLATRPSSTAEGRSQ